MEIRKRKGKQVGRLTVTDKQHQEDLQRLRLLRPIDDDFMRCLFKDNIPLAEFVLRIITDKPFLDSWPTVLFTLFFRLSISLLHQEKVQKYSQFLPEHIFQLPAYEAQLLLKIQFSYPP